MFIDNPIIAILLILLAASSAFAAWQDKRF